MALSLGELYVQIGAKIEGLEQGIRQAQKQFDALVDSFKRGQQESFGLLEDLAQKAGKAFGVVTNPLVATTAAVTGLGAAAAKGIKSSVQLAASLEEAMANVSTLVDPAVVDLDEMQQAIIGLSTKTNKSAVDLANGLYQVISAGVPAADAIRFLEVAAKAASSGMTDTFTAVDGLSSVINAFGLEATRVDQIADQMFQTVNLGKTTFPELATSIGQVAPTAAAAGLSTEELFAAIAEITKQGQGTSEAITGIRAALIALIRPTEDMQGALLRIILPMVEAGKITGPFAQRLKQLNEAYDKLTAERRLLDPVKDKQRFKEIGDQLEDITKSMGNAAASLAPALIQTEGFVGALSMVAEAARGDMNALAKMLGGVEALNAALALTSDAGQKDFVSVLQQMGSSAGAVDTAFDKQTNTLNAMTQQWRLSLEAIGLTVGEKLLPVLERFLEWINSNMPAIQTAVSQALDVIMAGFTGVGNFVEQTMPLWESLGTAIKAVADTGFTALKVALDGVASVLKTVVQVLSGDWQGAWETASGFVSRTMESLLGLVQRNIDALLKVLHINVDLKGIKEWASGVVAAAADLPEKVSGQLAALANRIAEKFTAIKDANIQRMQALWSGVVSAFEPQRLLEAITTAFKGTLDYLQNVVPKAFVQGGINIINAFLEGLIEAAKKLPGVGNVIAGFLGKYLIGQSPPPEGPLSKIDEGGRKVIEAWVQGILAGLPSVEGVGPTIAGRVAAYLQQGLPGGQPAGGDVAQGGFDGLMKAVDTLTGLFEDMGVEMGGFLRNAKRWLGTFASLKAEAESLGARFADVRNSISQAAGGGIRGGFLGALGGAIAGWQTFGQNGNLVGGLAGALAGAGLINPLWAIGASLIPTLFPGKPKDPNDEALQNRVNELNKQLEEWGASFRSENVWFKKDAGFLGWRNLFGNVKWETMNKEAAEQGAKIAEQLLASMQSTFQALSGAVGSVLFEGLDLGGFQQAVGQQIQRALLESILASGPIADAMKKLSAMIAEAMQDGLTAGELQAIKDQAGGVYDQLQPLKSVTEMIAEQFGLAADEAGRMNGQLRNVPSGFKIAAERFAAAVGMTQELQQAQRAQQVFAQPIATRPLPPDKASLLELMREILPSHGLFAPFVEYLAGIPALADGGIVTRPTVALIGEAGPEAVVPLGSGGVLGERTEIHVSLTIQGSVYADDLERRVVEAVSKAVRKSDMARYGVTTGGRR